MRRNLLRKIEKKENRKDTGETRKDKKLEGLEHGWDIIKYNN
ncbi:MAG: hypothetical protein AAFP00_08430 [Bacteroidota bacterium]